MRIVQAMAGAKHGGAELFFERLAAALCRAGFDQKVLIKGHEERLSRLFSAGLDPVAVPFGGRFDFKTGRLFREAIRSFRPEIIMTWMNRSTSFCPSKKRAGVPFIHVGRLGGYYDLAYYKACDHLVCNTQDLVRYVTSTGWAKECVHYLPNFVDERRAPPAGRSALYTPEGVPLVFALGRFHKNKGFDALLKAFSHLSDAYLWLAGDGPERESLEALAYQLGVRPRVRFLGWRDDVPSLYAAADLFVCPSRHEPLGNVILEAWAQHKPVMAASSQGPSALIQDGETGVLVPVDEPEEMARRIRIGLRDRDVLARLADNGYKAFQKDFTEARVVEQYGDFFRRILS